MPSESRATRRAHACEDARLDDSVEVTAEGGRVPIAVDPDRPLPAHLVGKAGFNLVKPDGPGLKTDWPFLWFGNDHIISMTSADIVAAAGEAP